MKVSYGKPASPGIALGKIRILCNEVYVPAEEHVENTEKEIKRFRDAMKVADSQLSALYQKLLASLDEKNANIIMIQQTLLQDEIYVGDIETMILEGYVSDFAVYTVGRRYEEIFSAMDDEYMRARSVDIVDISHRIVKILHGDPTDDEETFDEPFVLFAEDLTPSQTVQMDKDKLLAFVTVKGSIHSHTAILARNLGIPAIVAANVAVDKSLSGKTVIVDGDLGKIIVDPTKSDLDKAKAKCRHREDELSHLNDYISLPDVTSSGQKMDVLANIGSIKDCENAEAVGASGIGLFRTEFLYLEKSDFPNEEEQFLCYKDVVQKMKYKKVVIRTIDIGADKDLPYFHLEKEENPALGYRAIRICFDNPQILKTQLRAILRASAFGTVAVMFPMVISVWEVTRLREIFDEVKAELKKEKHSVGDVEFGIMIETPAAALIADDLAKKVDFFSLGTNDLTQYTLAIDRQNQLLEPFYNPCHDGVMKLIEMTVKAAKDNGIRVTICGELAGDLTLTKTFLEMGIDGLSVSPSRVLSLRKKLREL